MTKSIAGIALPDSQLANEAAELLHEYGGQLLWNHSHRAFLFGSLLGRQENQKYDPELLYVSAVFHDLGLTQHYRSADKRFEVDGANADRSLLEQHGLSKESTQLVWDAIALHQTIGVVQYKEPVVALLYHGVGFDVMGDRFEDLSEQTRTQVVSAFPATGSRTRYCMRFSMASDTNPRRRLATSTRMSASATSPATHGRTSAIWFSSHRGMNSSVNAECFGSAFQGKS
jgi:hypothetical protein